MKEIINKTIVTCDYCGATIPNNIRTPQVKIIMDARDIYGAACADATRITDACRPCIGKIDALLRGFKG